MLSSVSKLADKNFVIGFFLPALLAVFGASRIFACPAWASDMCAAVKSDNPFADVTYLALGVWVVAVLLLTFNYFEYRLLEGYLPPISWLRPFVWWHRWRSGRLAVRHRRLKEAGKNAAASRVRFAHLNRYPTRENDILPTRFGNAIRAFEYYPREVYGADSISIYLRLASVIPKDFSGLIDDARAEVNFFLNIWFLALVIAFAAALRVFVEAYAQHFRIWPNDTRAPAIAIVICIVAASLAYEWSIGRVVAWGDLVKSAFDCYLPALAKQLDYTLPSTESRRRDFWTDVSRLFLYRRVMKDGKWTLGTPPPASQTPEPVSASNDDTNTEDDNDD